MLFCAPVKTKIDEEFTLVLSESLDEIAPIWEFLKPHTVFLENPYLQTLERASPENIKPYYVVLYQGHKPVGLVYLQTQFFELKNNIRKNFEDNFSSENACLPIRKTLINRLNFHAIICGNLLLTGENGFYFDQTIDANKSYEWLEKAIHKLIFLLKSKNIETDVVLVKDFSDKKTSMEYLNQKKGYTKFKIQPQMTMKLEEEWHSFEDYSIQLKSKYRIRLNNARKKSSSIERRLLEIHDIEKYKNELNFLYQNVIQQFDFHAYVLHENYFIELKKQLKTDFWCYGYFLDEKLVAFHTFIKNNQELEVHFLGYLIELNASYQLYLMMLYDSIQEGISLKMRELNFSRTAVEIKSTIGASPNDLFLFMKHTNSIFNISLPAIINFITPKNNFTIRKPFKKE